MILKKLTLAFCFLALVGLGIPSTPVKADAGLTLGIIGTALGGSALGLGLANRYSLWRNRRRFGGPGFAAYPAYYGGYTAMPVAGGCGTACYAPQTVSCYRPVVNYVPVTYTVPAPVSCCPPVGCNAPVGCGATYGLFR
ncbi:MAG: hypothetical protein QNJ31_04690 [Candidatus Caenarcaniphilales bacterium]|nr:hypothetical protein [Candidatus Caenarcaniphilales bacterium]